MIEVPSSLLYLTGVVLIMTACIIAYQATHHPKLALPDTVYELRIVPHAWPGTVAESFSGGFFYERDLAINVGIMWQTADPTLTYYIRHVAMLEAGEYDAREYGPAGYCEDRDNS